MAADLVRVRIGGVEKNMARSLAEKCPSEVEILDEPARFGNGRPRPTSGRNGRPRKTRTTVAKKASEKSTATPVVDADGGGPSAPIDKE